MGQHPTAVPKQDRAEKLPGVPSVLDRMSDARLKRSFAEAYERLHHVGGGGAQLRVYVQALAQELDDRDISARAVLDNRHVEVVDA
jgi:hypothetical protein